MEELISLYIPTPYEPTSCTPGGSLDQQSVSLGPLCFITRKTCCTSSGTLLLHPHFLLLFLIIPSPYHPVGRCNSSCKLLLASTATGKCSLVHIHKLCYIISDTYDHTQCKIRDPVRSPIVKSLRAGLVVGSVTTSEYPVLYVLSFSR